MIPVRLNVRNTPNGLQLEFTSSLEGKLPNEPKRKEAMLSFMRESLEKAEAGKLTNIGHADGERPRMRRDVWLLEEAG